MQDFEKFAISRTADDQDTLVMWVPPRFALEWARVFGDLPLSLVMPYVTEVMTPGKKWDVARLLEARYAVAGVGQRVIRRRITCSEGLDTKPTDHHIRPDSRGGTRDGNIVVLPRGWHSSWHELFANSIPAEVPAVLERLMVDGRRWMTSQIIAELNAVRHATDGITRPGLLRAS